MKNKLQIPFLLFLLIFLLIILLYFLFTDTIFKRWIFFLLITIANLHLGLDVLDL